MLGRASVGATVAIYAEGDTSSLPLMVRSFPRRMAVASGASASLLIATTGGWRLAQLAGLAKNPRKEDKDQLGFAEVTSAAALAGVIIGAGYAIVRPALPRQPELAGLLYSLGSGLAVRLQFNAIVGLIGRDRRKLVSVKTAFEDAVLGLWLAETERLFE